MEQFRNLGLSEPMLEALQHKGFTEPSPIQKAVIPFLLTEDRDVVAKAQTGTGKTAAFGIPLIERIEPSRKVQALIIVPTRELALQVSNEIASFTGRRRMLIAAVYGGQAYGPQLAALGRGADMVVGTPGRLNDLLKRGSLDLSSLKYLVMDEADEMLNMGFVEEIESILEHVPESRQTLLFSATMPHSVLSIARRYLKDYETISAGGKKQTTGLTSQHYCEVCEDDKFEVLCRILDMEPDFYGLVFCRTRADTADLGNRLAAKGYAADAMHGDMTQPERERIMRRFRSRQITVLTATDVAARGIDVQELTHVINYALPFDAEAYVHRIGRTGRAGNQGTAISLVSPKEHGMLIRVRHAAGDSIQRMNVPKVGEIMEARSASIREKIAENLTAPDLERFAAMADEMLETADARSVLAACLRESYASDLDESRYRELRPVRSRPQHGSGVQLSIGRGRRQGLTPRELTAFISKKTGVKDRKVQDIRILEQQTLFTVPAAEANIILKHFQTKSGRPYVSRARPFKKKSYK